MVAAGCAPLAVLWTAVDSAVGPGDPGDNVFERAARLAFSDLTGDLSSAFLTVTAIAGAAAVVIMLAGIATPRVRRRIQRLSTPNADPGD